MSQVGWTVTFGRIEKGPLFAIKKQIRAYLRNRLRGEDLAPPRIWEDERRITFPGWPRETVGKALEYAYDRMETSFRTPSYEIHEATAADLRQREAQEPDPEVASVEAPAGRGDTPRDPAWVQHIIDKTTREVSDAYEDQLRRERARTASLDSRVTSLLADRDRLQKEKDEAEKSRRVVEEQNDNLLKSVSDFADDPSKAALQVVSRAASWIRRLEVQAAEIGGPPGPGTFDDYLAIAKQDLVTYANQLLAQTGRRVESVEELRRLTDPTPWEDTEFHKARSTDYLKAKEELEFLNGVESGTLRVPESVRDIIVGGLQRAPREGVVREFEAQRQDHQERRDAGSVAGEAQRTHAYATRLRDMVSNRSDKDPIPLAVVYRSADGPGRIEVRLPTGIEGGPLSSFLEAAVEAAATKAGFRVERNGGGAKERTLALVAAESDGGRADLLRRQGVFRESVTELLAESALKGAGVAFRILDIRDFEV